MTLLVATPVRGAEYWTASITMGHFVFLRELQKAIPVEILDGTITFACDVVRGRNRLAATVLREFPNVSHVLWLDDDQFCEDMTTGVQVVREMMSFGEDMVAAPYTNRRAPVRWVYQPFEKSPPIDARGLMEVRGVGFGFTMTSRACLERMSAAERKYTDIPNSHKVANIFGQLFDRLTPGDDPEDECLLSEDYAFCKRWREMGGKIHLYQRAGIICHVGTHAYSARDMPGGVIG